MSVIMGDPKTVLEGSVKYRDKKKWKSRWAVVSKLSPVADCLHIQLYRDSKERCKNGPTKASLSLEEFLGMETGFTLDKESNTMALICSELVVVLAFDNRELLIQWQVKIRANLVEEQQFLVQIAHVPAKSKLPCGPARLHLQDHTFCLVSGVPPRLLGTWPIKELRRFGVIEGKFCFEGGSLCGRGEGLHVLLTNQSSDLAQAMDLASKGKLLGKRKTLTRKNSVLETSTRIPLHKRNHHDSSKSTASDSHRLLLSSGSESSTCDACSEILRSADPCGDDCLVYTSSGSSIKASSCRIHYRWPSCLSRWGQSSTTTTSDVESMDTVSVTLSDFQGPSTISKSNGHGQSLSCLCDSQGTWPFNQCTKCGRQFYSRNSLQSCRNKQIPSPENGTSEATNGFSPQWTMDSLVGSTSDCQSKKDGSYQMMNPPSDRASLCSHASHSSSASVASSSGSEYSVPRNYLETLYDRPKSVQHALNGVSTCKSAESRRTNSANEKPMYNNPPESCILCPCHEPIKDWVNSTTLSSSQEKLVGSQECACWSKLSMSVRSEMDIRVVNGRKSASANASPNSSPKKTKYGSGANTLRHNNSFVECDLTCTCGKNDPYANYAIPKSAMVHLKNVQQSSTQLNGSKDCKMTVPVPPAEDYDVPKKFTDLLSNCDMTQKTPAMKTVANGPSCSCMSACKIVQNIELFKMASKHSYNHKQGATANPSPADALQMCACQRVMLWAGSLVPCLGPQRQSLEPGWQCAKSLTTDGKGCSRTWYNTSSAAVCSEPLKTAEAMMVNGKVKHMIRGASVDTEANRYQGMSPVSRPRSSTISYPLSCSQRNDGGGFNYANLDFSRDQRTVQVTDEPSAVNYANIEFAETLPLYENSNLVLSRLEGEDTKHEPVVTDKPPLPPRSYPSSGSSSKDGVDKEEKCKCVRRSPKKVPAPLKQTNSSAYEMMCYEKNPNPNENGDEDYLMMQPLCSRNEKPSPSRLVQNDSAQFSEEFLEKQSNFIKESENETEPEELPLRPFMPYSYPNPEKNGASAQEGNAVEILSRKNQLISEELQLRAMRSNSLSELKKKVLMRKRSSSVDGKNNGYLNNEPAADVESLPASPVCSPRITVQRKHSLFSKLNLRSKEKSMSTNEIAPTAVVLPHDGSPSLSGAHKNGLHRSADCLKLNEEYGNSDDELNSDNSDFGVQKDSSGPVMKRSSSVPCRAGIPSTVITSPVRTHGTIMELNDLNKDSAPDSTEGSDNCKDAVQRKYSLDSHERLKRTACRVKPSCDNMYRQECLDECDTVMEMQGVLRRNRLHNTSNDREAMVENYRSATSSCSSSDISDYMESLSFISRSSSSSSGSTSSADYIRAEDLYLLRTTPKPPLKNSFVPSNSITVPSVHQSRHSGNVEVNGVVHHRSSHADESSSAGTSSSSSYHERPCYPVKDELKLRPCGGNNPGSNRDSTSSTSSLSTSPSVTDYSSSTSSSPPCQNNLGRQAYSNGKCVPDSTPEAPVQQNVFVYPSSKDESRKT